MGRRVTRAEIAARLAALDPRYLEKVYAKWLWDCELALAFYGPIFLNVRMYGIWRGYTNASNQV